MDSPMKSAAAVLTHNFAHPRRRSPALLRVLCCGPPSATLWMAASRNGAAVPYGSRSIMWKNLPVARVTSTPHRTAPRTPGAVCSLPLCHHVRGASPQARQTPGRQAPNAISSALHGGDTSVVCLSRAQALGAVLMHHNVGIALVRHTTACPTAPQTEQSRQRMCGVLAELAAGGGRRGGGRVAEQRAVRPRGIQPVVLDVSADRLHGSLRRHTATWWAMLAGDGQTVGMT